MYRIVVLVVVTGIEVSNAIGFCIDDIEADILFANRATSFSHSLSCGEK
jgi:hypothetical protein